MSKTILIDPQRPHQTPSPEPCDSPSYINPAIREPVPDYPALRPPEPWPEPGAHPEPDKRGED